MVDSGTYTPEAIARRLQIAQQLLDTSRAPPVRHWTEGLNQLLQGYMGGDIYARMENAEALRKEASKNDLLRSAGLEAAPSVVPPYQSPMERIAGALGGGSPAAGATPAIPPMTPPASPGGSVGLPAPPQTTVSAVPRVAAALNQPGSPPPPAPIGLGNRTGLGGNLSDVMLDQPPSRAEVPSSPRVMGDREAVAAGLYRGPPTTVYPQPTGLPSPVSPGGPATANPPSAFPSTPGQPQTPRPPTGLEAIPEATRRMAVGMMNSDNPKTQEEGAKLMSQAAAQASPNFTYQLMPDGRLMRLDPKGGPPIEASNTTKPTFSIIGKDRDGNDVHGWVDPTSKQVWDVTGKPITGAKGSTQLSGVGERDTSTGQTFLDSLNDPARAGLIKGMVEGRIQPAQMGRYGTAAVASLLKDAAQYEPGFDTTQWQARAKSRADFSAGRSAEMVRAANQTVAHIVEKLLPSMDDLNNRQFPEWNKFANAVVYQAGGKGMVGFTGAAHAVADEMSKVFKGQGISDTEIRKWETTLSPNMSPDQQRESVQTLLGLLGGSIHALEVKRETGMGQVAADSMGPILNKDSQKSMEMVQHWLGGKSAKDAAEAAGIKLNMLPGGVPATKSSTDSGAAPITSKAVPTTTYSKEQINAERVKRGMPPL